MTQPTTADRLLCLRELTACHLEGIGDYVVAQDDIPAAHGDFIAEWCHAALVHLDAELLALGLEEHPSVYSTGVSVYAHDGRGTYWLQSPDGTIAPPRPRLYAVPTASGKREGGNDVA